MWIFGGSTSQAKEESVQRLRGEQAFNPIKEAGVAGPCESRAGGRVGYREHGS